jgi:hypothetical protein
MPLTPEAFSQMLDQTGLSLTDTQNSALFHAGAAVAAGLVPS